MSANIVYLYTSDRPPGDGEPCIDLTKRTTNKFALEIETDGMVNLWDIVGNKLQTPVSIFIDSALKSKKKGSQMSCLISK